MRRATYTLLLHLAAPLLLLAMARRARKVGGDWGVLSAARFGRGSGDAASCGAGRVWVHAVSLGETRAAQPLIRALLDAGHPVLLTHLTLTGRREGERLFGAAIASGQMCQTWLPYDFPWAVNAFVRDYAPRCGILIEREIWPNLIAACRHRQIPVALVSARFSAASLRQVRWMGRVVREALGALTPVLAQTPADAQRLLQAGAREARVAGNLKFDVSLAPQQLQAGQNWRARLRRPVVVLASTRDGEEALFADALAHSLAGRSGADRPLFVVVPRHPQRFSAAAAQLERLGLGLERRSVLGEDTPGPAVDIVIGDTLGEMAFYYGAADVAVVCGGFAPLGGQNLIEACVAGTAVIVGPHMFNFEQATASAAAAGAAIQVADAPAALRQAMALVDSPPLLAAARAAATRWAAGHTGATRQTMAALRPLLARPARA